MPSGVFFYTMEPEKLGQKVRKAGRSTVARRGMTVVDRRRIVLAGVLVLSGGLEKM